MSLAAVSIFASVFSISICYLVFTIRCQVAVLLANHLGGSGSADFTPAHRPAHSGSQAVAYLGGQQLRRSGGQAQAHTQAVRLRLRLGGSGLGTPDSPARNPHLKSPPSEARFKKGMPFSTLDICNV